MLYAFRFTLFARCVGCKKRKGMLWIKGKTNLK